MTISSVEVRRDSSPGLLRLMIAFSVTGLLFLAVGLGLGQWIVSTQFQSQELLVLQLQQEIRGLTGDLQQMESRNGQTLIALQSAFRRLDEQHRAERVDALQQTSLLKGLVQRELETVKLAEAKTLSEFSLYRRRHMAVPVEEVDHAIGRLVQDRLNLWDVVLKTLQSQIDIRQTQLASLDESLAQEATARSAHRENQLPSPFRSVSDTTADTVIAQSTAPQSTVLKSTALQSTIAQSSLSPLRMPDADSSKVFDDAGPPVLEVTADISPTPTSAQETMAQGTVIQKTVIQKTVSPPPRSQASPSQASQPGTITASTAITPRRTTSIASGRRSETPLPTLSSTPAGHVKTVVEREPGTIVR